MNKLTKFSVGLLVVPIMLLLTSVGGSIADAAGPSKVNLGTAGDYTILSKSGISTTGTTQIEGDMGVSPIAATAITGFGLTLDASGMFSTSAIVTGNIYASNYAAPTPANLTTAISDMESAYTDAAGRAADTTELGAGNIGGLTLVPGVYKWGTNVTIPTDVTLSGSSNDVWIFQISQDLTLASAMSIVLSGGAQAENVFWQVAGQVSLGTDSSFKGTILSKTLIAMKTGASINGLLLAQTAVTLDSNTVTKSTSSSVPTPDPEEEDEEEVVSDPDPTSDPEEDTVSDPDPTTDPDSIINTEIVTTVTPKLPNTGIAPNNSRGPWNIIIPVGIMASLFLLYATRRKQII